MKITGKNYNFLKLRVSKVLKDNPNAEKDYKEDGFSPTRFRWDCFWASKVKIGDGVGITGDFDIPGGVDNAHIDTALRKILKENGCKWGCQYDILYLLN